MMADEGGEGGGGWREINSARRLHSGSKRHRPRYWQDADMNPNWNTFIQNGGAENLGQALIRLARQAVAVHQVRVNELRLSPGATVSDVIREGRGAEAGVDGVDVGADGVSGVDLEVRR